MCYFFVLMEFLTGGVTEGGAKNPANSNIGIDKKSCHDREKTCGVLIILLSFVLINMIFRWNSFTRKTNKL